MHAHQLIGKLQGWQIMLEIHNENYGASFVTTNLVAEFKRTIDALNDAENQLSIEQYQWWQSQQDDAA